MAETKHTPGPWKASRGEGHRLNLVTAGDRTVAHVIVPADDFSQVNSNARLIAAAPELLEVARKLTDWNNDVNGDGIGLERICRAAKKALGNVGG